MSAEFVVLLRDRWELYRMTYPSQSLAESSALSHATQGATTAVLRDDAVLVRFRPVRLINYGLYQVREERPSAAVAEQQP